MPAPLRHLLPLLFFAACGPSGPLMPRPAAEMRCVRDGLCITDDGPDLLSGGYRRGELEVGFDAVHVADTAIDVQKRIRFGVPITYERLTLLTGSVIWRTTGPHAPALWEREAAHGLRADDTDFLPLISAMADEMRGGMVPTRWAESWWLIRRAAAAIAQAPLMAAETAAVPSAVPADYHAPPPEPGIDAAAVYRRPTPLMRGHVDHGGGTFDRPPQPTPHRGPSTDEPYPPANDLSPECDEGMPPAVPARVARHPGWQFQSFIEVHARPLIYEVPGLRIVGEHSATRTTVIGHPGNGAWRTVEVVETRNHGHQPGYNDMRIVESCLDTPVIFDQYVVGGECAGNFSDTHVCNDDSALQIFHAYGGWDNGSRCSGTFRRSHPPCGKPW